MMPDLSVVVPAYNAEAWLHECLEGVLSQSRVGTEVICVDDGSTDSTGDILRDYAKCDARVKVIQQANAGLAASRNSGLAVAEGRYVAFLDSDDYYRLDQLADLVGRADADQLDVLLFDAESVRDDEVSDQLWRRYRSYYHRTAEYSELRTGAELMAAMRADHKYRSSACLYLVRRALLDDAGIRFVPGYTHEDELFTFRMMLVARRASHLKVPIYTRRVRPGSIMTDRKAEASMVGYFVAYLGMKRAMASRNDRPEVAAQLRDIVDGVFAGCRRFYLELPEEVARGLAELESSPIAETAVTMLQRARRESGASVTMGSGSRGNRP